MTASFSKREPKSWSRTIVHSPSRSMQVRRALLRLYRGRPAFNACFAPGAAFAQGTPTLASAFSGPQQVGGVGMIAMGPDSHHPLMQQFSLGVQQQFGRNWVLSADGLYVFADRQLIGHLLRTTNSTSPYVSCPGNVPCTLTDPLNNISDNITLIESTAE